MQPGYTGSAVIYRSRASRHHVTAMCCPQVSPHVGSSARSGACLRARFDDGGGRRGGGDLRPLSRFLLPPGGGERSSLRRRLRLRSSPFDRLPTGDLRFVERPDDESEDASDELSLQCNRQRHHGKRYTRHAGVGNL